MRGCVISGRGEICCPTLTIDKKQKNEAYKKPGRRVPILRTPVPNRNILRARIGGGEEPATLDSQNDALLVVQGQDKSFQFNDFLA
jgi:hypothetical protein